MKNNTLATFLIFILLNISLLVHAKDNPQLKFENVSKQAKTNSCEDTGIEMNNEFGQTFIDVDGDGYPDIFVVDHSDDGTCIAMNNANGTFTFIDTFSTGANSSIYAETCNPKYGGSPCRSSMSRGGFAAGFFDFNHDGLPEIVIPDADQQGQMLRNVTKKYGEPKFVSDKSLFGAGADIDWDGITDRVGRDMIGINAKGKKFFDRSAYYNNELINTGVELIDVNMDGYLDIYGVNFGGWYENNENKNFTLHEFPEIFLFDRKGKKISKGRYCCSQPVMGSGVIYADLDGDGDFDAIGIEDKEGSRVGNRFVWINENYGENFTRYTFDEKGITPCRAGIIERYNKSLIADFDNDSDLDLVLPCTNNNQAIFINDGTGNFKHYKTYKAEGGRNVPSMSDYDFDGLVDISMLELVATDDAITLLKNTTSNPGNYLNVFVKGKGENYYGIGVVVDALVNNELIQRIHRGGNVSARGAVWTHLGLSKHTDVLLRIRWPASANCKSCKSGFSEYALKANQNVIIDWNDGAPTIKKNWTPGAGYK